jgi:chemotaxis methyl-accepting protein methylase/nitrogen-specific signal transduction histidine kinase
VTTSKVKSVQHYLVAICASAGDLEAIHEFFDNMPDSKALSFIVIQHPSLDHKSLRAELAGRQTNIHVLEVTNNLEIRRGCVYIIPGNQFIQLSKNKLILLDEVPSKAPDNPIDTFMQSLARAKKEKAIAVILSGTGLNGTKGIAAVKERGGLVIAQKPAMSKFEGMPSSAITSGNMDFILPAGEMPGQIIHYVAETALANTKTIDDTILECIFHEIRTKAGFDFNLYKTPTITRRIFHRMMKKNFSSIEKYLEHLRSNPDECRELGREFLINVTRFFRDKEAFDMLAREVIPAIIKQKDEEVIKVWVGACSTGEEVYSIAILFDEALAAAGKQHINVRIFGTDLDKSNIGIASKGYFPKTIEEDIEPERLAKYFTRQNDGYVISNKIRKQVVFAVHNIIKDPPFIKSDLVTCRNMLIYMNPALQQRVYSVLLFAANKDGYLFLGTTETANYIRHHLEEISGRWKIYKKVSEARLAPYFPGEAEHDATGTLLQSRTGDAVRTPGERYIEQNDYVLTLEKELSQTREQQHEILEKKVEERTRELMKMNHALAISNNDLQQFASVASHDLQEPLRKIHLYANLIHDRHGGQLDGAAAYLDKILQSSSRMKAIIDNIMSYSKLSGENAEFHATDINELIRELLEDLEISITEKNASVYVGKFPIIDTTPGQIRQVFQNIIGNALKFTKPDVPPQISITAVRVDRLSLHAAPDPKGDFVCITIKDNGIGFDERFAETIFLLFHRLHSKDAYEGTGIGLAIAKKIIEKHHGMISAMSKENQGSAFTIVLPVRQNQPPA